MTETDEVSEQVCKESIALVMGQVEQGEDVLCRVHSPCLGAHVFNNVACDGREQMALAQALIAQEGRGVIIWLDQEGKGKKELWPSSRVEACNG